MNYEKIYNSLIDRARNRALTGYKERHHIIPKCLGGSNDASNLVDLTPEEHYVAHQLLVKITQIL
ncbi:homing endonuclease [Escherichia phage FL23]